MQTDENSAKPKKAPGPNFFQVAKSLPLILNDRLKWMESLHANFGDVVGIRLGPRKIYAVFHPDYIRHVLVTNAKNYWKGRTFEKTQAYLGKGLATVEGPTWQVQRRRMNPQFHRDALKSLLPAIDLVIDRLIGRFEAKAISGELVDLALEFPRLAMEVVARSFFGVEVPQEKIEKIIDAFKESLEFTTARTLNPFDIPESIPLPSNIRYGKAIRLLGDVVYGMIETEKKKENSPTLLSMLIRASDPETGTGMTAKQLRDEVMTMFIGGTDTSGNTLSWIFYNLGRHPEVQNRVRAEVIRADGGVELNPENLMYTQRMIEETLRLFPQNWVGSRDSYRDDEIGGVHIPGGSTVFLGVYVAHRRQDFWTNPLQFDPDRFLAENSAGRHPMAYMPFGAGQRKCIGYHFAMMEFLLAIPKILHRFEFDVVGIEKIKPHPTWSLWPKPGVPVKLRLRKTVH